MFVRKIIVHLLVIFLSFVFFHCISEGTAKYLTTSKQRKRLFHFEYVQPNICRHYLPSEKAS